MSASMSNVGACVKLTLDNGPEWIAQALTVLRLCGLGAVIAQMWPEQ
eukprot:gene16525-22755_t